MEDDDEESGKVIPEEYNEGACVTQSVRNLGSFCWWFWCMCALSWLLHSFQLYPDSEAPAFASSLLYRSIAHHTDTWQDARASIAPSPPRFGDGRGGYPDYFGRL